jgi:hypothetical protein
MEVAMRRNDLSDAHDSATARRILAIDQELAALERASPRSRLDSPWLIPMGIMLGAIAAFVLVSAGYRLRTLSLWPVLLMVGVPSGVYAFELIQNWRRRLRLERELDELIGDTETTRPGRRWS